MKARSSRAVEIDNAHAVHRDQCEVKAALLQILHRVKHGMCSMLACQNFLPLVALREAAPRMARLLASVTPAVKIMLSGLSAFIS